MPWLVLVLAADLSGPAPPVAVTRIHSPIVVDGDLGDAAWAEAPVVDTFYETAFGDNRPPLVATRVRLAYDDRSFYVAVECDDPDPHRIRAPYVDRDSVVSNQDNFAIFLDTRDDRRSAQQFRVNPRGIQTDAVFNDATQTEDFSPDFYYDTAARITARGWQAEMRIPLASLRYPREEAQTWGVLLIRNYPRGFRYSMWSSPVPRGSNCTVCLARETTGLAGLPSSSHLVVAPYASAQDEARAATPGAPLVRAGADLHGGADVKWSPTPTTALDLTANPDFSQVEADVAQIAVNERFALFFPEKRPFFLEGVDLLETPIRAVYTRTVTRPRWGARATGKAGASSYTALLAEDEGGGSVILPEPTESTLVAQDFRSRVGIARWRRDLGRSFLGALATARESEGGAFNRVLGPDFQWRTATDTLTGQALVSFTQTPRRPDVAGEWDGRRMDSHAASLDFTRVTRTYDVHAMALDVGDGFRADTGFVAQVGYRERWLDFGYTFYPKGFFSRLRPWAFFVYDTDRAGRLLKRRVGPGIFIYGKRNLGGFVGVNVDRVRTGGQLRNRLQVPFSFQVDPSRRLPRAGLEGFVGQDVDLAGGRVGTGASLRSEIDLRPTDHLDLVFNSALSWLDVPIAAGSKGRLFTAQVQRLRATYMVTARASFRLVGQYVGARYAIGLYPSPVPAREGELTASALVSYRLNWQTAVYAGYGDRRALDDRYDLVRADRQLFVKVSYSFQR